MAKVANLKRDLFMEIKKDKQLKVGDVIEWEETVCIDRNRFSTNKFKIKCISLHPHFVLFRKVEEPFTKVAIQNSELWQKGIYQKSDILKQFVTKEHMYDE